MSVNAGINSAIVRAALTQRATVYSRTNNTGPYNNAVKSGLACLLLPINRQPAATGAGRRELAAIGEFRYDALYDLPTSGVQLEIDAYPGVRWNPVAATGWPDYAPGIGVVGRTVDVTRAL